MDGFERRDHFNYHPIINEAFQKIKNFLIKNYWNWEFRSSVEHLFDEINKIILEILQTDGKNLEKTIIFKILNF